MQKITNTNPYELQHKMVDLIKKQDQTTLKKLYTKNYKKVQHYILKNSGSVQQAKDIYQDAFITMWRNVSQNKFEPQNDSALSGYLYQIAKNKWLDYLRSSAYKKTTSFTGDYKAESNDATDADDQTEKQLVAIKTALKHMGSRCQELLRLFYYEKKSLRSIASQLGLEENSARNAKYRCMEKLRTLALNKNYESQ